MHQIHRERDEDGRVVATFEDYEHARRFLYKPLNEASGSAVPRGVREAVEQLLVNHGDPVHPYADRGGLPIGLSLEELAARMSVDFFTRPAAQKRTPDSSSSRSPPKSRTQTPE